MLTFVEHAEVYAPEPPGARSILLAGDAIPTVGSVDRWTIEALGVPLTVIDAGGCLAVPGLIDPHEHLIGA